MSELEKSIIAKFESMSIRDLEKLIASAQEKINEVQSRKSQHLHSDLAKAARAAGLSVDEMRFLMG